MVLPALDRQLRAVMPGDYDGQFARAVPGGDTAGLSARDQAVFARMGAQTHPLDQLLSTRVEYLSLNVWWRVALFSSAASPPPMPAMSWAC